MNQPLFPLPADQTLAALKLPPHSVEAEQAVLGGLLLDEHAFDRVSEIVTEDDFYRRDHRLIFRAIAQLAEENRPRDALTLAETLRHLGLIDEAGGIAYITELVKNTPSAANIKAYAEVVRERSILRQLIKVSNEVADAAFKPEGRTSLELLDEAESKIFAIAEQQQKEGTGPRLAKDVLKEVLNRMTELHESGAHFTGVSTGFTDLDTMTSGMQKGDLLIVAARPSMGKTTFAMNLVENAAIRTGQPVLVFSMEMPSSQIMERVISSLGRVELNKIKNPWKMEPEDWPRVTSAMTLLSHNKMLVDDTAALTPVELRARARRVARDHGPLALIMVDYLQLMRVPGAESRVNEISEISRSLKALAKEMMCPVLALSQLNRGVDARTDKRPMMSDLRESGAIEQDADVIMFIYRDEVYNKERSEAKGMAEIIIGKQRNGPIGSVNLAFLGRFTRFEDLAPEYYQREYQE